MQIRDLYYCNICGNVVELLYAGAPSLVCCGQDMEKLDPKTKDQGLEKHVPVIQETEKGILVKVGSTEHPSEEKHYIAFIEVLTKDKVYRAELKPGDKPQAEFPVKIQTVEQAREFCNVHMLWKN
jgi:superoxide reductase